MARHKQHKTLDPGFVATKLEEFFSEDNAHKDITTLATQKQDQRVEAVFIAKEELVFAGSEIIRQAFCDCKIKFLENDGARVKSGSILASLTGPINTILKKERVVLNLLQRLCGITTTTNKIAGVLQPHGIELLDTRKTTPGLREFEKFAVFVGGGVNHRFSLSDAVMIKDNHLIGNPDIMQTTKEARAKNPDKDIEVEVDTKEQLEVALNSDATSVLLDNFAPDTLQETLSYIRSHPKGKQVYVELSGGITEDTIGDYCISGVNGISMGALTHNIKSRDISLELKES